MYVFVKTTKGKRIMFYNHYFALKTSYCETESS
jgi:hypothetical protein